MGTVLRELVPQFVVMYDADIQFVRQVEVCGVCVVCVCVSHCKYLKAIYIAHGLLSKLADFLLLPVPCHVIGLV